ncbi:MULTISPECIES: MarR family winged helix-turn-helix transcriptional regulator [unclassified Curtobacterium]|uniref:MarR family winged helix-turn-helix transcriptional regulator n=1 Tax=unclassified Curtobacterium TaxID=257496 RepID=UPI000DA97974|nr:MULTISPECIES: MarR family transcriptional regulator [unclassified Curtobacterium]PZE23432.1 MarR family transcriptional regulator [Curtobacterium sp. MCBD17_028]PZF55343.1 MarR family transcriptional regulator [Curtobacterium sp. MCBD17_034]PZM32809.1 MarR family transcriptional regulator [Curtobacterium sp. MCBD17_031]WIB63570.1 MarR family transcriptional regulator [Curtobacterium sp. MCBD17_040]
MDEPRWLNKTEAAAWMDLLAIIELLPSALDAQLKRDFGMTRFEYNVLSMLSESPDDSAPMSSLAFLTNGSLSRLSHAVTKLEKRGWVRRVPSETDKRSLVATLTAEGRALIERAAPHHVEEARRAFFDAIPPERVGDLAAILRPIAANLLTPDADCGPAARAAAAPGAHD